MTRLAICIGVSNPGGGMEKLPGAINGANEFGVWAAGAGYDVVLCTDEQLPVTRERLRDEIHKTLSADKAYDRILVYYAGHGYSVGLEDFWLLPGFVEDSGAAVSVEYLKLYLKAYQPRQLAIISDACRTTDSQFSYVLGSAVIRRPSTVPMRTPEIELYRAASLGDPAYMKKDPEAARSKCLFSEILLRALSGQEPDAFEDRSPLKVVSSGQLKAFLEDGEHRRRSAASVHTSGHRARLPLSQRHLSGTAGRTSGPAPGGSRRGGGAARRQDVPGRRRNDNRPAGGA